jgi:hypothetical protein
VVSFSWKTNHRWKRGFNRKQKDRINDFDHHIYSDNSIYLEYLDLTTDGNNYICKQRKKQKIIYLHVEAQLKRRLKRHVTVTFHKFNRARSKSFYRIVMIICYSMREGVKFIHEVFWTNTALGGYLFLNGI